MAESDSEYFQRRAEEERLAAGRATHPLARRAHLELAGRYDEAADAVGSNIVPFAMAVAGRR
jgi:hypothetical protein